MNRKQGALITNQAYDFLYQKIVSCEYLPGQDISEKHLLEVTHFGRTPLREALLLLQHNNLVEIFPRKGMRITPFSEKQVIDLYMYRKLIEPNVASQYHMLYSKNDLLIYRRKLEGADKLNDWERFVLDSQFHNFLISITKNSLLMDTFHSVMVQQIRLGMYSSKYSKGTPEHDTQQHLAIINALLRENETDIKDTITIHINYSMVRALDNLHIKES